MSTITLTASAITASFPATIKLTPISTPINHPPTYATLRAAQTQLNANAASIPSHGGDGLHGHVVLTLSPAAYTALSDTPFVPPLNPPQEVIDHPAGLTNHQITEINRLHVIACSVFRTYNEVDKALRTQIIDAVADQYIEDHLYDPGYGHVSCLSLLTHLWAKHGKITQDELDANQLRMQAPWNPPTPIDALFTQLNIGICFATAGNDAPSEASVIRIGCNIINATGMFDITCRSQRHY